MTARLTDDQHDSSATWFFRGYFAGFMVGLANGAIWTAIWLV